MIAAMVNSIPTDFCLEQHHKIGNILKRPNLKIDVVIYNKKWKYFAFLELEREWRELQGSWQRQPAAHLCCPLVATVYCNTGVQKKKR